MGAVSFYGDKPMTTFATSSESELADQFLLLMPSIKKQASYAFRSLNIESRAEAIADVVANAWVAFCRLAEAGKSALAYPTTLARYAIAQFNAGRRVGTSTYTLDVTSPASTRKHGHHVESITPFDLEEKDSWKAIVVEDRSVGPAEVAELRIDFEDWLRSLSPGHRNLATQMSEGYSTSELAENNRLSRGRISQIRRELEESWRQFSDDESGGEGELDYFSSHWVDWDQLDLERSGGLAELNALV